jgi:CheY-like chemotaxis protein
MIDDKKLVLIVDDEENLREIISEMFEMFGGKAISASNMQEALEIVKRHKTKIDLAIIDYNLDGVTGDEVLKEIEQIDDTIYTVLASGMITEYDREKYENLGFDEIIKKPYRMEDLNTLYEKC